MSSETYGKEDIFLNEQNIEQIRSFLTKVLDLGLSFKLQSSVRQSEFNNPDSVQFTDPPIEGVSLDVLAEHFKVLASESTNFSSPNFVGFPDAGNATAALSAAILIPFLNQNLINQDFCGPAATFLEMETIHWLRKLLQYDTPTVYKKALDIGGCCVHGGVLANTIAMLAARESLFPNTMRNGITFDTRKTKILAPAGISHYSIRMALAWLGLGETSIAEVPINTDYKIEISQLEATIERHRELGNDIMAMVVYAGDSRTMSIDNLDEIGRVLTRHGIWFHVDACHGLQVLFSEKYRSRLQGIEMADSVTIDPHKVLWIPYVCSYVLFKSSSTIKRIASSSDLITKEVWSLGQTTPFIGSKAFNALKFWAMLRSLGCRRIGEEIDRRIEFTESIQRYINSQKDLLLLNETDINSVMFMFVPELLQKREMGYAMLTHLNDINLAIKNKILQDGHYYVHGFPIPSSGYTSLFPTGATLQVLRIMNGNPNTSMESIERLVAAIVQLGRSLGETRLTVANAEDDIRTTPMFAEFTEWLSDFAGGVEHVSLVYGSSVRKQQFFKSDVDLMVIAADEFCTDEHKDAIRIKVIELHAKYSLRIDEEVPYDKKLLVPLSFARASVGGGGFISNELSIEVPDIVKTPEFLNSSAMLARLALNVVTTKVVVLTGNFDLYYRLRQDGIRTLIFIMFCRLRSIASVNELCDALYGDQEREGELYLGYKDRQLVDDHLRTLTYEVFKGMLKAGQIVEYQGRFLIAQRFQFDMLDSVREHIRTVDQW